MRVFVLLSASAASVPVAAKSVGMYSRMDECFPLGTKADLINTCAFMQISGVHSSHKGCEVRRALTTV